MARGGYRPGAGRPKSSKNPRKSGKRVPVAAEKSPVMVSVPSEDGTKKLPLDYMIDVMNDPEAEQSRRDRMAIAATPFMHPKYGESGKKEEKKKAAEAAGSGKFKPAAPPKLVVNNTR